SSADASLAARFLGRRGVTTITSPLVETSTVVAASMPAALSRGRSSTRARLFPVFVRRFLIVRTFYINGTDNDGGPGHPYDNGRNSPLLVSRPKTRPSSIT